MEEHIHLAIAQGLCDRIVLPYEHYEKKLFRDPEAALTLIVLKQLGQVRFSVLSAVFCPDHLLLYTAIYRNPAPKLDYCDPQFVDDFERILAEEIRGFEGR